jgi:hypothetical protein
MIQDPFIRKCPKITGKRILLKQLHHAENVKGLLVDPM